MRFFSLILPFLCLTLLISLKNEDRYFEGKITYEMTFRTNPVLNINPKELAAYYGEKMVLTIKDGFIREDSYYKGIIIQTKYYNPKKPSNTYWQASNPDSLLQSNPSDTKDLVYVVSKLPDTIIDNRLLKPYLLIGRFKKGTEETHYYFAYDSTLRANPEWFSLYKEGNTDEIIKDVKGLRYYFEVRIPAFTRIYKAVEIEPGKVDEKTFQVPDLPIRGLD